MTDGDCLPLWACDVGNPQTCRWIIWQGTIATVCASGSPERGGFAPSCLHVATIAGGPTSGSSRGQASRQASVNAGSNVFHRSVIQPRARTAADFHAYLLQNIVMPSALPPTAQAGGSPAPVRPLEYFRAGFQFGNFVITFVHHQIRACRRKFQRRIIQLGARAFRGRRTTT